MLKKLLLFLDDESIPIIGTAKFLIDQNRKYLKDQDGNYLITPGTRPLIDQNGKLLKDQNGNFLVN